MSESDKTMRSWKLQGDAERTMVELQDAAVPVAGPGQLLAAGARREPEPRRIHRRPRPAQARRGQARRHGGRRRSDCRRRRRDEPQGRRPRVRPLRRRVLRVFADGRARGDAGPAAPVDGRGRRGHDHLHDRARHADGAGRPHGGRMAAGDRNLLGRGRGRAADRTRARRESHRHLGLGGKARETHGARARCGAADAQARLCRCRDEGDRRSRRQPRS